MSVYVYEHCFAISGKGFYFNKESKKNLETSGWDFSVDMWNIHNNLDIVLVNFDCQLD